MLSTTPSSSKITLTLVVLAAFCVPVWGQTPQPQMPGVIDDWSTHHVVFSNPGTEEDAIRKGTYDTWLNMVNDPRYISRQFRGSRSLPAQRPQAESFSKPEENFINPEVSAHSAEVESGLGIGRITGHPVRPEGMDLHQDWSVSMGTGTSGTDLAYPAKFGFLGDTASCSDYVVYPTAATSSTTVPNIVAYNNLYKAASGGCTTANPTTAWSVSMRSTITTYGTVTTSPIISIDGTEVAFMETSGGHSYLVVVLTPTANASLTAVTCAATNVNTATRNLTPQVFCKEFGNGDIDTGSSPFYDYLHNILYVGDDSGVLHQFTTVFHAYGTNGASTNTTAPTETTSGGWPATVSTGFALTSPVFDAGTSQKVWVADSDGLVESVSSAGVVVKTTSRLSHGVGFVDAPILDSSTEKLYLFGGEDENAPCATTRCSAVTQIDIATFATGTLGTVAQVGTSSATIPVYDGDFDNTYYTGGGTTGNLYACGNAGGDPTLYKISMSGTFGATVTTVKALTGAAATCSPITEVDNSGTDWIFFSVTASGNLTGGTNNCSGACVYSYNVTGTPSFGNGLAATGGASGIVIDTTSTVASPAPAGTSQIYFSPLTATSAVQASQSGLQ